MFNLVTSICRTCLGLDGPFLPIYENKPCEHHYVAQMLDYTFNFKTSKTDGLSQVICEDCNKEINRSHSFKIKCENSNKLYRELFHIPDDVCHEQSVVKFDTDADQEHPQMQDIPHSTPLTNTKVYQEPVGMDRTGGFHTEFRVDLKDSITIEEPQLVMEMLNATIKNVSQQNPQEIGKKLPNAKVFACSKCQKAYPSPDQLSIHICYETNNESLNPSNTIINANNENNLKKPTSKYKKSRELSCPTCGKKYQLMFFLRKHMRTHNSSRKGDVTIHHVDLEQQVQLVSEGDTNIGFENSQALAETVGQENLKDIQANKKLCTCSKCKRIYSSLKELRVHDCSQSNNESLNRSCILNTKSNLKKHKINSKNRSCRYSCLACGKNYQLLYYLKKHMQTHKFLSNDKRKQLIAQIIEKDKANIIIYDKNFEPQQLTLNLKNYADNGDPPSHAFIDNHDLEFNGNSLYSCSKCQKDYPSQEELGTHDCNEIHKKSFNHPDTSTASIENTSGESNQNNADNKSCSICGKKYQLLYYLRKHIKSHKSLSEKKIPAITIHRDLKQRLPLHFQGDAAKGLEKTKQNRSQQSQTPADKNIIKSNEETPLRHSRRKKIQTTRMRSYLEEKTILQRNANPKEKTHDEKQNENNIQSTKKDSNPLTSHIPNEPLQPKKRLPEIQHTKKYFCPRCRCSMTHKALKIHIKQNRCTRKFYTCSICKKVFNSTINLSLHFKKHGDNDYKQRHPCTYPKCNKTFVSSKALNDHMDNNHEKNKTFVCLQCNKGFSKRSYLQRHSNRHTNTNRYKCQLCTRAFSVKADLKLHLQKHNDERSYSCEACDKKFFWRNSLKDHQRIHTGEMPFSCDVCPQRFAYRSGLRKHRLKHTD